MKLEEKLKNTSSEEIWEEYCGFLDLHMEQFMQIQKRLLMEQIQLWKQSGVAKRILKQKEINDIASFRKFVPLTTYEDYAEILLSKKESMLPAKPLLWIQTTWEGGTHPVKVAPYSEGMLETFKRNVTACLLLSTAHKRGHFDVKSKDKILYGLAPLPYATGLLPLALDAEIGISFLPPVKEATQLSFSQRNKLGFKMGLNGGMDYFFGLGSVTYYISKSLASLSSSGSSEKTSHVKLNATAYTKLVRAKIRCQKEKRQLLPKDLFQLKGFMVAGTDNASYKDDLEDMWGIRPMEVFAGTEPTCVGCEAWDKDGMYFFPDACFYEFIPYEEMLKCRSDKNYKPITVLMDEVQEHKRYELVISVLKGGAFMRYRVGDVYQCIALQNHSEDIHLPRFAYVDRVPDVIDIGGFTRITKNSIDRVIELSNLKIKKYIACKEYNENKRPYLHMYVELSEQSTLSSAISQKVLKDHLSVYFKYVDADYEDLKKILGVDPLVITILRSGTFAHFEKKKGKQLDAINPEKVDVLMLLEIQNEDYRANEFGGLYYE